MLHYKAALFASLLVTFTNAFYLPGNAPHNYQHGESVELFVNALTPMIGTADNAKLVRSCLSLFILNLNNCIKKSMINCTASSFGCPRMTLNCPSDR